AGDALADHEDMTKSSIKIVTNPTKYSGTNSRRR
ncbi:MAG: hypothetical protein RL616_1882, partial [Verrucomicrobiota bacterium]